jgi:integrase
VVFPACRGPMDFHHQVKSAIHDAYDDGLLDRDPTRKAIIKGKEPGPKKAQYLSQFELKALLNVLDLRPDEMTWDWLILLIAKTGLRFGEALGITPKDFDFATQTLDINKTWNYKKGKGGFQPTKNESSKRKIQLDWQTATQFSTLIMNKRPDRPIFVPEGKRIHNSTINYILQNHCIEANVPEITIHALRHTHASLLLYSGVSVATLAKRLGHSNMTTTQNTYLHIVHELENQDNNKMMNALSNII